jgi:hypothetical protein
MNTPNDHRKMGQSAVLVFTGGSTLVYLTALGYCLLTGRQDAALMMGVLLLILGGLAWFMYKKIQ